MYIESVPNRGSPPCILLRESFRDGGKIRKRTLANLTNWPAHVVEGLRRLLQGGQVADAPAEFEITRSLPHGHVLATLGTLRRLGLDKLIATRRCRQRDLAVAMIVARIIAPGSKLALSRGLSAETSTDSLAGELGLTDATVEELYEAMDWLLARQDHIEQALADRHLRNGTVAAATMYFEGKTCSLGQFGHSRDDKKDKLQIVFGQVGKIRGRFDPRRGRSSATEGTEPGRVAPVGYEKGTGYYAIATGAVPDSHTTASTRRGSVPFVADVLPGSVPFSCDCVSAANVRSCWPPPRRVWPSSPRRCAARANRCGGRARSACG